MYWMTSLRTSALAAFLLSSQLISAAPAADRCVEAKHYETFMRRLTDAMNQGKPAVFDRALDGKSLVAAITKDQGYTAGQISELRKGIYNHLPQVSKQILKNMQYSGSWKLLHCRPDQSGAIATVRMDYGDDGLDYMKLRLQARPGKGVVITDWYMYSKGEWISDHMQQIYGLLRPAEPRALTRLLSVFKPNHSAQAQTSNYLRFVRAGDSEKALKAWARLPEKLRHSRLILLLRVQTTSDSDDYKAYMEALATLAQYHGDDPTLGLVLLDHYFHQNEYDKALKSLDRLEQQLGADAGLDQMRSYLLSMTQQYPQAIATAQRAIDSEPDYEDGYWSLLHGLVGDGQFAAAIKVIKQLEDDFQIEFDPAELAETEGFADFARSLPFKLWRATYNE